MEVNSAAAVQDQYLTLLVSQLQNQDPLEPVSQEGFLGQVAQFSTLSGIEKLNTSFEQMVQVQADLLRLQEVSVGTDLVGKTVEYVDGTLGGGTRSDEVTGFDLANGRVQLSVGGTTISVDQVLAIK